MTSLASAQSARLSKRPRKAGSTAEVWRPTQDMANAARSGNGPPAKRARTEGLDGWLGISDAVVPELIVPSKEITDRGSTFLAHACCSTSKAVALAFREKIRREHATDPAIHEMCAWRCVQLKEGFGGAHPNDFTVSSGGDEDGEKWAATHMQKVLEETNSIDIAVVCTRWYGGNMIGPARFQHIRDVCREAIQNLQIAVELDELVVQIKAKDAAIAELAPTSPGKVPSYDDLDVAKAKRLLLAREKRFDFLQGMAKKAEAEGGFVRSEDEQ